MSSSSQHFCACCCGLSSSKISKKVFFAPLVQCGPWTRVSSDSKRASSSRKMTWKMLPFGWYLWETLVTGVQLCWQTFTTRMLRFSSATLTAVWARNERVLSGTENAHQSFAQKLRQLYRSCTSLMAQFDHKSKSLFNASGAGGPQISSFFICITVTAAPAGHMTWW